MYGKGQEFLSLHGLSKTSPTNGSVPEGRQGWEVGIGSSDAPMLSLCRLGSAKEVWVPATTYYNK